MDDYYDPRTDLMYRQMKRDDYEFMEAVVKKLHGRPRKINYKDDAIDWDVMQMLLKKWEQKRPGQLKHYKGVIERTRKNSHNNKVTNRSGDTRFVAFMPVYLDALIKATWPDQQFDDDFYKWFLKKVKVFQVPEKL